MIKILNRFVVWLLERKQPHLFDDDEVITECYRK